MKLKNAMNHLLSILVCALLLVLIFPVRAYAQTSEIEADGLIIQVDLPEDFAHVFSRKSIENDSNFSFMGMGQKEILDLFSQSNIYLEAATESFEKDFKITVAPTALGDFSTYSDVLLDSFAESMQKELTRQGYKDVSYVVHHHADTNFLCFRCCQERDSGYTNATLYYTIINGLAVSFTCSYMSEPSWREDIELKKIIDSTSFREGDYPILSEKVDKDYPSFAYKDNHVSFTLPEGWCEQETDPNHKTINAKFAKVNTPDIIMTYGFQDLWSETPISERIGLSRSDYSLSNFTESDIQKFKDEYTDNGYDVNSISRVTYGGLNYLQIVYDVSNSSYGIALRFTNTQLMCIENGYSICFSLNRDPTSEHFKEFIDILNTVNAEGFSKVIEPASTQMELSTTTEQQVSGSSNSQKASSLYYLLALIPIPIISGILLVKERIKKKQMEQLESANRNNGDNINVSDVVYRVSDNTTSPGIASSMILFCHICGAPLNPEETSCKKCGTLIPR